MMRDAVSRRTVLSYLAWLPLAAAVQKPETPADRVLRLLVAGTLPDEARHGLHFGLAEASVTAHLMGRELQMGRSDRAIAGAIGVIVSGATAGDALPARTPALALAPAGDVPPQGACTFRIGLSASERDAALARWRAANETPSGARLAEWHPALVRYGASELNERFGKATGRPMTAAAWRAWIAVKALVDAALRPRDPDPCAALRLGRFDGHKGRPLTFDPVTGLLRQPLYVVSSDTVIGELAPEG
jgi:hypothetical protein